MGTTNIVCLVQAGPRLDLTQTTFFTKFKLCIMTRVKSDTFIFRGREREVFLCKAREVHYVKVSHVSHVKDGQQGELPRISISAGFRSLAGLEQEDASSQSTSELSIIKMLFRC